MLLGISLQAETFLEKSQTGIPGHKKQPVILYTGVGRRAEQASPPTFLHPCVGICFHGQCISGHIVPASIALAAELTLQSQV